MKKILLSVAFSAIMLSASADDGVYYSEDFEWLAPWSAYVNGDGQEVGNTVGDDNLNAYCPFIDTPKVEGVSAKQAMEDKGMKFLFAQQGKTDAEAGKSCYLQKNYLKFGKSNYQSGIVLPSVDVPAGVEVAVKFDWCPMRQGDGKMDPTKVIIIVENGEDKTVFDVPEHGMETGSTLAWIPVTIKLENVSVNKDTKISIRPEDAQWSVKSQHRWFIDNIKVLDAKLAAINEVATDVVDENAPVEYFNLQGVRVNADNLSNGIYVRRQGSKTSKVIVR